MLGQLGNRVQHALRAFTPKDQKRLRAAAETFRSDGSFDVEQAIGELAVGEALVSLLDEQGVPMPVDRAKIVPPASRLGTITPAERRARVDASPLAARYARTIDRESAYELLKARADDEAHAAEANDDERPAPSQGRSRRQSPLEAMLTSTARSLGTQIGRQIVRGIFGSMPGRKRRRR